MNVDNIRKQFPIYEKYPNIRFFDSAASSLKHIDAIKAVSDYLSYNGTNVHRGVYKLAAEATENYENSREVVANFIHAKTNEIVFTKSTTHAINMLARSLEDLFNEGDEVILSELEHHSNLMPWLEVARKKKLVVKYIPLEKGSITIENFKKVLTDKTRLVATHHISNVFGYITPIKEMIKLAHEKGSYVFLDCAQSAAQVEINVRDLDVDFIAFSGHKLYGPNGIGVLYGKQELLEKIEPAEFGGEMVDRISITEKSTYKAVPYKFESGTPAIAEAIGLARAIKFVTSNDRVEKYKYTLSLRNYILENLKDEVGITIFNKDFDTNLINLNIDGVHPHDVASFLDHEDVCVRAGHHCNQLSMRYLDQNATIRASVGIYNTKEDCDVLIKTLKETRDFFIGF